MFHTRAATEAFAVEDGSSAWMMIIAVGCMRPATRNTGEYEKRDTTYPVPRLASMPTIDPPIPENPLTVPTS